MKKIELISSGTLARQPDQPRPTLDIMNPSQTSDAAEVWRWRCVHSLLERVVIENHCMVHGSFHGSKPGSGTGQQDQ